MKIVDDLFISHDRSGLTMADLRAFVKRHEGADVSLRHNRTKSDHETTVWDVIDNASWGDSPMLAIDPDERWLLAEKDKKFKRKPDENLMEWRARIDEEIRKKGYYVDSADVPHWVLTADSYSIKKAKSCNYVVFDNGAFRIYYPTADSD